MKYTQTPSCSRGVGSSQIRDGTCALPTMSHQEAPLLPSSMLSSLASTFLEILFYSHFSGVQQRSLEIYIYFFSIRVKILNRVPIYLC